jgi:hypothetical protein
MGGIMPDRERDAAIKRLRRAAEDVLAKARDRRLTYSTSGKNNGDFACVEAREKNAYLQLSEAWRDFPECERDDQVPSPEDVLARCDAYDRQKTEAEKIAARLKDAS